MRALLFATGICLLATHAWAENADSRIRERMAKLFPGETVSEVSESPVPGLYEVLIGASVFYMTADGKYAMRGDLLDLESRQNLSEARRADARGQAFANLDDQDVITFSPASGKTRATVYAYTDVDCGYCRKLHNEVPALNKAGIAVSYLAFPRAGLKSESYDKIQAVWCSPDRRKAMTAAKAGKNVKSPPCENPVASQFHLGQSMGVGGTPALYNKQGEELGGYIPAKRLIKLMEDGKI